MTLLRQTLFSLKFVVALSSLIVSTAYAAGLDLQDENKEAQIWLHRIQLAAQRVNYSGTFVYQQANQVRTSRITHLLDGKNELEKLEILDGKPREYIRTNDEIVCYLPETRTLIIEKKIAQDIFPAIIATSPSDVAQFYSLRLGEIARVAGYESQELFLEPKDGYRYGYRLWAERASGLLLRAQTINEKNEIVEQIAFAQVEIGNINRSRIRPSFLNTTGWHIENSVMISSTLVGFQSQIVALSLYRARNGRESFLHHLRVAR